MEKRKRIGFTTSASEMQERFDEIRALLGKRKVNWAILNKRAILTLSSIDKLREEASKVGRPEDEEVVFHLKEYRELWLIIGALAKLGSELTETHERLASVEKSVAELSRRIKQT
jgi:hypothetical protein